MKVCIDPGHGGTDPGATGNGLKEKDLTLYRSLRTAKTLQANYQNVEVLMTRTNDATVSLQRRCDIANNWGADFFISNHTNAGGGTGFESYRLPGAYASTVQKQTAIHNEIMAYLKGYGLRDRGLKTANFQVLRATKMSAVLIECLFIDYSSDASLLKQQHFQDELADATARGIAKALGLQAKPKPTPAPANGKLYRVQIGAYKVKANAEKQLAKAKAVGFTDAFIVDGDFYRVQIGAYRVRANAEKQLAKAKAAGFTDAFISET